MMTKPMIKELIKTYDDYLAFAKETEGRILGLLVAYGYQTPPDWIARGEAFRTKIDKLKSELGV